MIGIWVGAVGFLIAFSLDLVSVKRIPVLKPIIIATVVAMQLYALYTVAVGVERFFLPAWLARLGWIMAPVGFCLLIYSIFIEVPFLASYARKGNGSQLVTSGTYALTRHPGVLWFAAFLAGFLLATRSRPLLIAAPVWLALEVVWVLLEDRVFLAKAFPDYARYRQETPMLIPNGASIKRFILSWKGREP